MSETLPGLIFVFLQPVDLPPRLAMPTPLDAGDETDWPGVVERLCTEWEQPVPGPPPLPPCPYRGMQPFSEAGGERFFGWDE